MQVEGAIQTEVKYQTKEVQGHHGRRRHGRSKRWKDGEDSKHPMHSRAAWKRDQGDRVDLKCKAKAKICEMEDGENGSYADFRFKMSYQERIRTTEQQDEQSQSAPQEMVSKLQVKVDAQFRIFTSGEEGGQSLDSSIQDALTSLQSSFSESVSLARGSLGAESAGQNVLADIDLAFGAMISGLKSLFGLEDGGEAIDAGSPPPEVQGTNDVLGNFSQPAAPEPTAQAGETPPAVEPEAAPEPAAEAAPALEPAPQEATGAPAIEETGPENGAPEPYAAYTDFISNLENVYGDSRAELVDSLQTPAPGETQPAPSAAYSSLSISYQMMFKQTDSSTMFQFKSAASFELIV